MILEGVLIAVCQQLHRHNVATIRRGRRSKFVKRKWDPEDAELVHHYADIAEPVLIALVEAGYVPLLQTEVAKAWRPRVSKNPTHPVIRLNRRGR